MLIGIVCPWKIARERCGLMTTRVYCMRLRCKTAPIHPLHLSAGTSTADALHAVDTPMDINRNGSLEFITAEMGTSLAQIIEIAGDGTFRPIFAFPEPFLPRAVVDTDNDGLIEILCNSPASDVFIGTTHTKRVSNGTHLGITRGLEHSNRGCRCR